MLDPRHATSQAAALADLHRLIRTEHPQASVLDLLQYMRSSYLAAALGRSARSILARAGIRLPEASTISEGVRTALASVIAKYGLDWGDWRSHLRYRLHLRRDSDDSAIRAASDLLSSSLDPGYQEFLFELVQKGIRITGAGGQPERRYYDLSILPLNLLLGQTVLRYFLPPRDYLLSDPTKKADPYGLLWASSRATTAKGLPVAVVSPLDAALLGSHKFTHTLLMNIDFYCPIGCSDCYKARFGTREYVVREDSLSSFSDEDADQQILAGAVRLPTAAGLMKQARSVVAWMNGDPRGQSVHDVIVSGGEPLLLSNQKIAALLEEMSLARALRTLRLCTGTLFLGLPMRIDDELADLLGDFSDRTGIRVTIQAHLASYDQIVPEAVIAIARLRQRGITIYTQTPIKEGVNFFLDDPKATMAGLVELGRRQVAVGVEPYMFIVDMHPSTNAFYVPIEPLIAVWGGLVESHEQPGLERPRTLSILFEGGNVLLSGALLFAMHKIVDRKGGIVTYRIPRISPTDDGSPQIAEVFEYREPISSHNDDPQSLARMQRRWNR